jgi:V-type H+-transporting ATPase subunit E
MNQDQQFLVNNLQKMIKYIQQETDKKVQMIKKEAAKDADLEKALLINPEKVKIAKKMEKELENYKTSMKIEQSKKMNKLRLEKLKVKIDCVNSVFEEAKNQLALRIKNDEDEYKKVLKDLMIQGFIKLLEENINIICKKEDYNLVNSIVDEAKEEFLEKLKKEAKKSINLTKMNVTVDNKFYLPDNLLGGVFLTSLKSKIRVDNTLDKRLELLKQSATPEIRKILFDSKKDEDKKN